MKRQLADFAKRAAHEGDIFGMDVPAEMSGPVITCDNSEMTRENFTRGENGPRLGYLLSVPFYRPDGALKGMVTAVIREFVITRLLGRNWRSFRRAGEEMAFPISDPSALYY
jgi:hypothetical protein